MARGWIVAGAVMLGVAGPPAWAESPFDGRWKIELSSIALTPRTQVVELRDGTFSCRSCAPPYAVPADGAFHAVAGQDEFDETALRIVDARTVARTNRLRGRTVREETRTLAPDGATATMAFADTINPGVAPVGGRQTLVRVAPAPAGAHALSGGWQARTASEVSEAALIQTFRIEGDMLTLTLGEGFSYTAKLDGTPAAAHGDPIVDTVSVRRVGERELSEVDSSKGRPVARFTMAVSADGSRLVITSRNEKSGAVTTMTAHRT